MNLFIPKVRVTHKNHPIWFNAEIRHTIKCLRTQRKKCSMRPTLNNQSKLQYLEFRLNELMIRAKLQSLTSQTSTKSFSYGLSSTTSVPPIVSLGSFTSSNDCDKVSLFNTFFNLVFARSEFQIPPLDELPVPGPTLSDIGISELDVFEAFVYPEHIKSHGIRWNWSQGS